MATPTEKNPEINNFVSNIAGKDRVKTITNNTCMFCDDPDLDFRDELSRKEYRISGLCQHCQDTVFGE